VVDRVLLTCFGVLGFGMLHAQTVLPKPERPFAGKLDRDVRRATPAWPEKTVAPKGAPNVLLILVDAVGFSTTSTFGGPVATPNFDKLATTGLRYNEFHVNGICAPTRRQSAGSRRSSGKRLAMDG
jgi:arylsulfatase